MAKIKIGLSQKLESFAKIDAMARVLLVLLFLALTIFAFIDCARTPSWNLPGRLPKALWLILILLLPVIGALVWLFLHYQEALTSDKPIGASDIFGRRDKSEPSVPLAPDEDLEFLAHLDALNKRKAYEARKAAEKEAAKAAKKERRLKHNDAEQSKNESDNRNTLGDRPSSIPPHSGASDSPESSSSPDSSAFPDGPTSPDGKAN